MNKLTSKCSLRLLKHAVVFLVPGVLVLSHSARAADREEPLVTESESESKQDVETELRVGLNLSGYEKIRNAWKFESSYSRRDVYLDFFEGNRFQMRSGSVPVKARFMNAEKGTKWQVAELTQWQAVKSEKISATAKESRRIRVDGAKDKSMQEISSRAEKFYNRIAKDNLSPGDLQGLSEVLLAVPFIQDTLDKVGQSPSGRLLLAAEVSQKQRLVTEFKTKEADLGIVLGSTTSKDLQGNDFVEYEIEGDCDGGLDSGCQAAFAKLLAELERIGLSDKDLSTQSHDAFAYAETIYAEAIRR
jgi:hypothetical protein